MVAMATLKPLLHYLRPFHLRLPLHMVCLQCHNMDLWDRIIDVVTQRPLLEPRYFGVCRPTRHFIVPIPLLVLYLYFQVLMRASALLFHSDEECDSASESPPLAAVSHVSEATAHDNNSNQSGTASSNQTKTDGIKVDHIVNLSDSSLPQAEPEFKLDEPRLVVSGSINVACHTDPIPPALRLVQRLASIGLRGNESSMTHTGLPSQFGSSEVHPRSVGLNTVTSSVSVSTSVTVPASTGNASLWDFFDKHG